MDHQRQSSSAAKGHHHPPPSASSPHSPLVKCASTGQPTIPEEIEGPDGTSPQPPPLPHHSTTTVISSPISMVAVAARTAPPPQHSPRSPLVVGGVSRGGRFAELFEEEGSTPATAANRGGHRPAQAYSSRRKSVDFASAPTTTTTTKTDAEQPIGQASATAKERRHAYTRAQTYRSFNSSIGGVGGVMAPPPPLMGILKNGCSFGSGSNRAGADGAMAHPAWQTRSMSYNRGGGVGMGRLARQHSVGEGSFQYQPYRQQPLQQLQQMPAPIGQYRRSTSGGKSWINSSMATLSPNGEGSFYFDVEYNEEDDDDAFTDSELEELKPSLPVVRKTRPRTLSGTVPPVGYSPKWGGPTMCLQCLEFFNLPDTLTVFAEHLLKSHCIVVEEMELIVDLKRYIEYWRQQFAKKSIDTIFPKIYPREGAPYHGKTDYYFEMSERVPEDYALRQRLAMRRLEEALQCQQREREERTFHLQCLFCRYTARGNRSKIIHHLYMIHHLNLGSPDNLVFVAEYVEYLKEKLDRNECIYCEKTFTDRPTLMEHMRKKNHREVNPKNHYYDKFYIINYLELGKRWLEVLAEDFEDTMPTFIDSDDEEEEESWHEWKEDSSLGDEGILAVCLFCAEHSDESVEALLEHMKVVHGVDLLDYIEKKNLGFYDRMKLVNFIRNQTFNRPPLRRRRSTLNSVDSNSAPIDTKLPQMDPTHQPTDKACAIPSREDWCVEESLVPLFGNDHLLWMLESYLETKEASRVAEEPTTPGLKGHDPTTALIAESRANTVEGVEAEDWPDLTQSLLNDKAMVKSLR